MVGRAFACHGVFHLLAVPSVDDANLAIRVHAVLVLLHLQEVFVRAHVPGVRVAAGDGRRCLTGACYGRMRLVGGRVRDAGRALALPGLARGGAAGVAPSAGEVAAATGHLGDARRRVRKVWDLRGDRRSRDRGRMDIDVVGRNGRSGGCELLWVEEVVVSAGVDMRDVTVGVVDDGFEGVSETSCWWTRFCSAVRRASIAERTAPRDSREYWTAKFASRATSRTSPR